MAGIKITENDNNNNTTTENGVITQQQDEQQQENGVITQQQDQQQQENGVITQQQENGVNPQQQDQQQEQEDQVQTTEPNNGIERTPIPLAILFPSLAPLLLNFSLTDATPSEQEPSRNEDVDTFMQIITGGDPASDIERLQEVHADVETLMRKINNDIQRLLSDDDGSA